MPELTPETVNTIGGVIIAALAAWQARGAMKTKVLEDRGNDLEGRVKALENRVRVVEAERDQVRSLFRAAVRHIREWMAWATNHAPGMPAPPLPPELRDEV